MIYICKIAILVLFLVLPVFVRDCPAASGLGSSAVVGGDSDHALAQDTDWANSPVRSALIRQIHRYPPIKAEFSYTRLDGSGLEPDADEARLRAFLASAIDAGLDPEQFFIVWWADKRQLVVTGRESPGLATLLPLREGFTAEGWTGSKAYSISGSREQAPRFLRERREELVPEVRVIERGGTDPCGIMALDWLLGGREARGSTLLDRRGLVGLLDRSEVEIVASGDGSATLRATGWNGPAAPEIGRAWYQVTIEFLVRGERYDFFSVEIRRGLGREGRVVQTGATTILFERPVDDASGNAADWHALVSRVLFDRASGAVLGRNVAIVHCQAVEVIEGDQARQLGSPAISASLRPVVYDQTLKLVYQIGGRRIRIATMLAELPREIEAVIDAAALQEVVESARAVDAR